MGSKKSSAAFLALGICAVAVVLIILYGAGGRAEKKVEMLTIQTEYRAQDNMPSDGGFPSKTPVKPTEEQQRRQTIRNRGKSVVENLESEGRKSYFPGSRDEKIETTGSTTVNEPRPLVPSIIPSLSPTMSQDLLAQILVADLRKIPEFEEGAAETVLPEGNVAEVSQETYSRKSWTTDGTRAPLKEDSTDALEVESGPVSQAEQMAAYATLQRLLSAFGDAQISQDDPTLSSTPSDIPGVENEVKPSYSKFEPYASDPFDLTSIANFMQNVSEGVNTTFDFFEVLKENIQEHIDNREIAMRLATFLEPPLMSGSTDAQTVAFGRNAYEKSLTAFAFMSFGIFLLKQIQRLNDEENNDVTGRQLQNSPSYPVNEEPSYLSLLFEPPAARWRRLGRAHQDLDQSEGPTVNQTGYFNNYFRGAANLLNAYTKDTDILECIWSLYCSELDTASARDGLYGVAARINSIGLRLIMDQIPAELTFDVLLRSLIGWDGLPCNKMFPKCHGNKAKMMLQAATSGSGPSS